MHIECRLPILSAFKINFDAKIEQFEPRFQTGSLLK